MSKKLIVIVLGIGAAIAVCLGIIVSSKNKEIKHNMEQTLNTYFSELAKDSYIIESFEPFVCSGFIGIGCYSKQITVGGEIHLVLQNAGFEVVTMSNDVLKTALNVNKIAMKAGEIDEYETQDVKAYIEQLSTFIPHKIHCDLSFGKEIDLLNEQMRCNIVSDNASYDIQSSAIYSHKHFLEQDMPQILQDFYLKLLLDLPLEKADYKYSFENFNIKAQDKSFSKDLYNLYEIQSKLQSIQSDKDEYKQSVENTIDYFTIMMGLALSLNSDGLDNKMLEQFNAALKSYLLGELKTLKLSLKLKDDTKREFAPLDDLSDYVSNIFNTHQFEVATEPK